MPGTTSDACVGVRALASGWGCGCLHEFASLELQCTAHIPHPSQLHLKGGTCPLSTPSVYIHTAPLSFAPVCRTLGGRYSPKGLPLCRCARTCYGSCVFSALMLIGDPALCHKCPLLCPTTPALLPYHPLQHAYPARRWGSYPLARSTVQCRTAWGAIQTWLGCGPGCCGRSRSGDRRRPGALPQQPSHARQCSSLCWGSSLEARGNHT